MFQQMDMAECPLTLLSCVLLGCGIGTGPGVIQDHYSPTMGRHRTNQHYSDHVVNGSNLHQAQFDSGNKPFIKQNQVEKRCLKCFSSGFYLERCGFHYIYITNLVHRDRIHQFSTTSRTTWCRCSPRTWLHVLARKGKSMLMRYSSLHC